jgi:transcription-repair coupling factor (superfamily II helicase)
MRLNLYRRLSSLREESDLKAMVEEMQDRFGPSPPEVANLISVMSVRLLLKKMGVVRLDVSEDALIFTFSTDTKIAPERLVAVVESKLKRARLLSGNKLKLMIGRRPPLEALFEAKKMIGNLS